jgi:hypothetical protein
VTRSLSILALTAAVGLAACDRAPAPDPKAKQRLEAEPETVDVPQPVQPDAPGTTPMAERVAVIGFLNKRNGISRDLEMRPGQAFRVGDAIVRLRACETTASWEVQKLTGAFLQLDVRNSQGEFQRIFSGWIFKETPSLNAVEHPIYDVWPKSCAMKRPEDALPPVVSKSGPSSSRSSAPNSAAPADASPAPAEEPAPAPAPETAADSNSL